MKRIINKIVIHFDKTKLKKWLTSDSSSKSLDYYICRVCKHMYPETDMTENDESICKDCSKH